MTNFDSLQQSLDLVFNNPSLLQLAFVHSSYVNESTGASLEPNERLEFLGDAVLDLVVADELYHRYPDRPEGHLTQMRAALVRGDSLARIARRLDLGERLLIGKGEDSSGGRKRNSNLAGVFEALIGAVYVDRGYEPARQCILKVMNQELDEVGKRDYAKNAKSELQELVQAEGRPPPVYRIVDTSGQDHARTFTAEVLVDGEVLGTGAGQRKSIAEQEAAKAALDSLD